MKPPCPICHSTHNPENACREADFCKCGKHYLRTDWGELREGTTVAGVLHTAQGCPVPVAEQLYAALKAIERDHMESRELSPETINLACIALANATAIMPAMPALAAAQSENCMRCGYHFWAHGTVSMTCPDGHGMFVSYP